MVAEVRHAHDAPLDPDAAATTAIHRHNIITSPSVPRASRARPTNDGARLRAVAGHDTGVVLVRLEDTRWDAVVPVDTNNGQ